MPHPLPPGHHSITPSIVVRGAARLIGFLELTFGASLISRYDAPDGTVMHAEVRIGDSAIMFGEASGAWEPMPTMLSVYVDDVDATYARALAAGASAIAAPSDTFYGHRSGRVLDAWGNKWMITAVIELVSDEEIARRMAAMG